MKHKCILTKKETDYIKPQAFSLFQEKLATASDIKQENIKFNIDYQGVKGGDKFTNKLTFIRKGQNPTLTTPAVFEEVERRDGIANEPDDCSYITAVSEWKTIKYFFPDDIFREFENKVLDLAFPLLLQPNNSSAFLEEYIYNHSKVIDQIQRRLQRLYGSDQNELFIEQDGEIKYFVSIKF